MIFTFKSSLFVVLTFFVIECHCSSIDSLIRKGEYLIALQKLKSEEIRTPDKLITNYLFQVECLKALERWSEVKAYLIRMDSSQKLNAVQGVEKLINYSHYFYSIRNFDESLNFAEEALNKSKVISDPILIAKAFTSVGYVYHLRRNDLTARIYFDSALVSMDNTSGSDEYVLAWIYHCYGNSFNNTTTVESLNDYRSAIKFYDRDLAIYNRLSNRTKMAQTLYTKAWVSLKVQKWELGMSIFNEGLKVLLPGFNGASYRDCPTVQPSYSENLFYIYINLMSGLIFSHARETNSQDDLILAYQYNLLRIKLFLYLKNKHSNEDVDLPYYSSYDFYNTDVFVDCAQRLYQINKDENILKESLYYASKSKYAFLTSSKKNSQPQYFENESDELSIYKDFSYRNEKPDLNVYKHLLRDGSLIIDYYNPVIYSIDQNGISIIRVDTTSQYLKSLIDNLYSNLGTKAVKDFALQSNTLYKFLLAPILKDKLVNELIIIPSTTTSQVPFASLVESYEGENDFRKLKYIVRKYDINILLNPHIRFQTLNRAEKCIFISPEFKQDTLFSYLQFTSKLTQKLSNEFDGVLLTGNAASKENVLALFSDASVIHFSSHTYSNNNVENVSIALSGLAKNDRLLTYDDICKQSLFADLVVLNGCNTSKGKELSIEGVLSLGRAFLKAGSKSVVTTLWEVDDYASANLLDLFYDGLSQAKTKSKAMREAQLNYLQGASSSESANPYYWGGFIVMGDSSALDLTKKTNLQFLYFGIGFILLISLIILFRIQTKSA